MNNIFNFKQMALFEEKINHLIEDQQKVSLIKSWLDDPDNPGKPCPTIYARKIALLMDYPFIKTNIGQFDGFMQQRIIDNCYVSLDNRDLIRPFITEVIHFDLFIADHNDFCFHLYEFITKYPLLKQEYENLLTRCFFISLYSKCMKIISDNVSIVCVAQLNPDGTVVQHSTNLKMSDKYKVYRNSIKHHQKMHVSKILNLVYPSFDSRVYNWNLTTNNTITLFQVHQEIINSNIKDLYEKYRQLKLKLTEY